jgi:pyridoxal phosphate enzyme (YggS family)
MDANAAQIRDNYRRIRDRTDNALRRAGRLGDSVRIVVASKGQPVAAVNHAIRAGARIIGENYAVEGLGKMQATVPVEHGMAYDRSRAGQSAVVAQNYAMVQSLDSLRLAQHLDAETQRLGRVLPVLLEFNVGGEAAKRGWDASDERTWAALGTEIEPILHMPGLRVRGLMAIPPAAETAEASRPYFVRLRRLRDFLAKACQQASWDELSMGMSQDFGSDRGGCDTCGWKCYSRFQGADRMVKHVS